MHFVQCIVYKKIIFKKILTSRIVENVLKSKMSYCLLRLNKNRAQYRNPDNNRARNTVRAQCGTYASHFVAGTYVGSICLALCNRHLFIYILNIIDIRPFFDNKNVNLC